MRFSKCWTKIDNPFEVLFLNTRRTTNSQHYFVSFFFYFYFTCGPEALKHTIRFFRRISRMHAGGLLRKHKLDSWAAHVPQAQNTWTSVSVGQISPLLTILSGGVATSLALLLVETAVTWLQRQHRQRNTWSGRLSKELRTKYLFFRV